MTVITVALTPAEAASVLADPEVSTLLASGDLSGAVEYLNGPGGTRPRDVLTSAEFQLATVPAIIRLAGQPDGTQRKWDRILAAIRSVGEIHVQDPYVLSLLDLSVADGLLMPVEVGRITGVPCSVGSGLLGRDVTFTAADVFALLGAP